MIAQSAHLGFGVYPIVDGAKLVGARSITVRHWLDPENGIITRRYDPEEDTISFLELMELLFVRMFRYEGVSLRTIRKAAQAASQRFETDYPFAVKRFDTDGKTIFATLLRENDDDELIEDLKRGQYVFRQIMRPFFKKLEYGDQEALRYWPLMKTGRVVLDPERKLGQPIDAKTGIPTRSLYQALLAGGGQDAATVAKWFDVPRRAVEQAAIFEESLA